ncbi:adenylyltransferase/cytidyltransferase family protein [Granulicella cerasi]|uniref:FAD synthase n=1 Tax=Granulicella cerasi TaxID=741063 RepID=A0ABW1Z5U8_9BACT
MKIFHSLDDLRSALAASNGKAQRTVVTIGNFDGVHRGHQMVIANLRARAEQLNALAVAVTFDPHPSHILRPEPRTRLITPTAEKLRRLALTGLDATLVLPFDDTLRLTTARQFAEQYLQEGLRALEVHEGENFRFGHDAEADIHSSRSSATTSDSPSTPTSRSSCAARPSPPAASARCSAKAISPKRARSSVTTSPCVPHPQAVAATAPGTPCRRST